MNRNEIIWALQKMLDYSGVEPVKVECNRGSAWFRDKRTGKTYCLSIVECEGRPDREFIQAEMNGVQP